MQSQRIVLLYIDLGLQEVLLHFTELRPLPPPPRVLEGVAYISGISILRRNLEKEKLKKNYKCTYTVRAPLYAATCIFSPHFSTAVCNQERVIGACTVVTGFFYVREMKLKTITSADSTILKVSKSQKHLKTIFS